MIISRATAFLTGALMVAGTAAAVAADLPRGGSLKDTYAAPATASAPSWYIRFDGTYSAHETPSVTGNANSLINVNMDSSWSAGGGVGAYFSHGLRGDVTWDHGFAASVSGDAGQNIVGVGGTGSMRTRLSRDVVLWNLYYDFDNNTRFTPYIGAGLGFVRHHVDAGSFEQNCVCTTLTGATVSHSSTDVAAAAMAGVTYNLWSLGGRQQANASRALLLDVGYRYLYLGHAPASAGYTATPLSDPGVHDIHAHEVRVGLRYNVN